MAEFSSALHNSTEHLIVAPSCKQYFSSIELEESASYGPYIDSKTIRHAKDWNLSLKSTYFMVDR